MRSGSAAETCCLRRALAGLACAAVLLSLGGCDRPDFLAHSYYVNEPASWRSLRKHGQHLSLVSPDWFVVDESGGLHSTVDPKVVEWARTGSVPLLPLVVNRDFRPEVAAAVLATEGARRQVVEQLVRAAEQHHFAGLVLDFEHVPAAERDHLTRFVVALASELRRGGRRLGIAVHPPLLPARAPDSQRWVANEDSFAFDLRVLSRHADFISLMAYDMHFQADDPGPIASLPWVEACLQRTLKFVPRQKLLLGVPFYHRHWSARKVDEGTYAQALELAEKTQARIETHPFHREKTFTFLNGEGANQVWFNAADDVADRIALARRYRLRGFSAWRLGQEDPALWTATVSQLSAPKR
ncbi:MAG: glycosyl hydrolase family 18 protein [Candidatus Acidiferrales bacterium]